MTFHGSDAPGAPLISEDSAALPKLARGALFALFVLFSMNLLNYVDRYVFAAVGLGIQRDLSLTKESFGYLSSSFMVVYTLVAPFVGWLNDRVDRRRLLAFGVGLWSVATVGTAFARSFNEMFWARAFLGIGEASYGVVAPTLLAEFFDIKRRGRVMALFYLALPVGTAIGYGVGGKMEELAGVHAQSIQSTAASLGLGGIARSFEGWRLAFWVVGIPGLILALLGLALREPGRKARKRPTLREYLEVLKTPSYVYNTAGLAAITFTTGAFGIWFPTYFEQVHHTKHSDKIYLGLALAGAGLVGVLLSMWLPDLLLKRTRRAYMLWAGTAVFLAVPIGAAGLLSSNTFVSLGLLTLASIFMASCLGPCTTVTANVVPANRRGVGFALSIFLLHLFGDIPSPPLVGWVADKLGSEAGRASATGRVF
jgi:MFS family permease